MAAASTDDKDSCVLSEFVIPKSSVQKVTHELRHISKLFDVELKFDKEFTDQTNGVKQWISAIGENSIHAKEYISALVNPEMEYTMLDAGELSEKDRFEIERDSHAIVRCSPNDQTMLLINGTDINVVAALSMIEDRLKSPSMVEEEDDDFVMISPVKSTARNSNTSAIDVDEIESPLSGTPLSVHAQAQKASLFQVGFKNNFSAVDIEKGLSFFDMDDVVRPADFLDTLKSMTSTSNSNENSYVTISSDEEEDYIEISPEKSVNNSRNCVVKPFQTNKQKNKKGSAPLQDFIPLESRDSKSLRYQISAASTSTPKYPGLFQRNPIHHNATPVSTHFPLSQVSTSTPISTSLPYSQALSSNQRYYHPESSVQTSSSAGITSSNQQESFLRYIVIDGSNVARGHKNGGIFSAEGLKICIDYFRNRGHPKVVAFVSETVRYSGSALFLNRHNRDILERLNSEGWVKYTPARRINGKTIASYEDRFILNLALNENAVIVSNDQFRDFWKEAKFTKLIETSLLQYCWVDNTFMPAEDPLGRNGPMLDEFLIQRPRAHHPTNHQSNPAPPSNPVHHRNKIFQQPSGHQFRERERAPSLLPTRSEEMTQQLYEQLIMIFPTPEQKAKVYSILTNHSAETDINKLTNFCLSAFV